MNFPIPIRTPHLFQELDKLLLTQLKNFRPHYPSIGISQALVLRVSD